MPAAVSSHDETPSETLSVTVELEKDADPISGSVSEAAGQRRSFSGWLELIAALQRARDEGRP